MGSKIELVKAWQTSDGRLFKHCDLSLAMNYQEDINNKKNTEFNFKENLEDIRKYIKNQHDIYDPSPFIERIPWDCEVKENPIGICVYDYHYDPECCVYCGNPEERK